MKAVIASACIGLAICSVVLWLQTKPKPVHRYHCWMVTDGAVYCYAEDGHIFRPRFDRFVLEVGK